MRRVGSALVLLGLSGACTFGSLASFDIQTCTAAATQGADVCDRLNYGNSTSCNPWQCNPGLGACVQKTRDDDHDGDPPVSCGGGDCDDADPTLNSATVSPPTTVAQVILGSSTPTLAYDGVTPMIAFVATTNGAQCVTAANADPLAGEGGSPASGTIGACSAIVTSPAKQPYDPAQPFPVAVDPNNPADVAIAFVATTGCPDGQIGFDLAGTSAEVAAIDSSCSGAALPALALSPGGSAVIAYYATSVRPFATASPLEVCGSASPAALTLVPVGDPQHPVIGPHTTLSSGTSTAPPSLRWTSSTLFVASAAGDSATVWALDASLQTRASVSVPSLKNARAVALALHAAADGSIRIALTGSLGCNAQAIHLALLSFDETHGTFAPVGDVELSPSGAGFKDAPSIAWATPRSRWLATWVSSGPVVSGRFIDDSAKPSEAEFPIATGAFGAVALGDAHAVLISSSGGQDSLLDSKVRCP